MKILPLAPFALLAALTVLGGCVGLDNYPSKGDARPHPGVEAARQYPIQGIDISRWQGEIDWASVKAAGTRFVYIKATEGGDHVDPAFQRNWEGARRAGVPRGAYHFVYWCRPAHEQAVWFKQQIPNDPDALPPVLDLEWNGHSKTCPKKVERSLALEKIRLMLTELEQLTGKKPVIYTDITFHKDILEGEFNDYPYWIRSTAAKPEVRYNNRPWAFWQFTTTGRVPGIKGDVDRNAFYGNEGEFTGWREGRFDIGTRTWTRERRVPPQPSPGPEHTPVATMPGASRTVATAAFQPAPLGEVVEDEPAAD
ncbi:MULTISPECIES: glycoside hydrolase family 25 protein [unclassified Bosea (in: a-proteobacteria)]|uniref:glycoside hydrolase family 25 protein n=1 Tax=unclassified Bosea (in: a-proteobacteria) TaxID=2653178 RepID=UPI001F216023|nr:MULTISPECIES: glycoside hydrolase family 25 protein [unclassified Bosea (in: a-proteobacteria)]